MLTIQVGGQDFSKGGVGDVKERVLPVHQIVMLCFPPVVGCLLEKGLLKGITGTPGPTLPYSPASRCRKSHNFSEDLNFENCQ